MMALTVSPSFFFAVRMGDVPHSSSEYAVMGEHNVLFSVKNILQNGFASVKIISSSLPLHGKNDLTQFSTVLVLGRLDRHAHCRLYQEILS